MFSTQPKLQTLPTECIIEIMKHLKWTEMGKLVQTCKQFNEIVSTNSKLLENVTFIYSRKITMEVQLRKYTKFQLEDCGNENLQEFKMNFFDNMRNIRELSIGAFNRFNILNLIEILSNCQNLKVLIFNRCFTIYPNDEEFKSEFRLKLDSLTIYDNFKILKYFENSSVKSLTIYRCCDNENLSKFLATQTELEELKLESFRDFYGFISKNCKFNLKSLTLESCTTSPELVDFLIAHQNSLENVKLKGVVSSTLINMLANLKKLNLKIDFGNFINSEPIQVLSNVRSLEMSCKNQISNIPIEFSTFDGKFPNMKKFRLVKFESFKPLSSFEHLESCSLESTTMKGPFNAPKLKNLKFYQCTFQMIRTPFNFNKNSIENLEVKNCYFAAWIYQFFQHQNTKLNSLVLYNKIGSYQKEIELRQKAVDENRYKVKDLKIIHF